MYLRLARRVLKVMANPVPDRRVSRNSFQVELNGCSLEGAVLGQSVTRCLWSVVYIDAHDRFDST